MIGLIDVDGKLPNLALMKISSYYKAAGEHVEFVQSGRKYEKIFISCLFTWNRHKAEKILKIYPHAEVGGTGWDIHMALPEEIEAFKPDYDLYTVDDILPRIHGGIATRESKRRKAEVIVNAGMGFTSRGCIRSCGFCFVPQKEGCFRQVTEIKNLINPKSKDIILFDNNLTADPNVIEKLHEIRDRGLVVDITQGIDIRLLTPEIAQALSEVKHLRSLHYAWDLVDCLNDLKVINGIQTLAKYVKVWRHMCFMLTGYNTTFEQDMYRFRVLTEMGVKPYVMPFNKQYPTKKHHCFASWVNSRKHTVCSFEEFEPWVKVQGLYEQLKMTV